MTDWTMYLRCSCGRHTLARPRQPIPDARPYLECQEPGWAWTGDRDGWTCGLIGHRTGGGGVRQVRQLEMEEVQTQ